MTVKEALIEMMRAEGYDYFTAAEWATKAIREFLASPDTKRTLYCGSRSVTFEKRR